ncbi:MAG: hypothetical protein IJ856_04310, partial [Candidatus Methanomethylophilaceae archaeon]|nr:hypothetical protein [Candidatus Methanomethylophilaceae archaeon]
MSSENSSKGPAVSAAGKAGGQSGRGFDGEEPSVVYRNGRFLLNIPRFNGTDKDQFNTAIDCEQGIIPTSRLDSVKRPGGKFTRPATIDLTSLTISPLEQFTLEIDFVPVFENEKVDQMLFDLEGNRVLALTSTGYLVADRDYKVPREDFNVRDSTSSGRVMIHRVDPRAKRGGSARTDVSRGFVSSVPKINFTDGGLVLHVPRFACAPDDALKVTIVSEGKEYAIGNLVSEISDDACTSVPTDLSMDVEGFTPLDAFSVKIDGTVYQEYASHDRFRFASSGMIVSRPEPNATVIHRKGSVPPSGKYAVLYTKDAFGYSYSGLGQAIVRRDQPEETVAQKQEKEAKPVEEKPKKPKKKVKTAVTLTLSQPSKAASIRMKGEVLPIYSEVPVAEVHITAGEPESAVVRFTDPAGEVINEVPVAGGQVVADPKGYEGVMYVEFKCSEGVLAKTGLVY